MPAAAIEVRELTKTFDGKGVTVEAVRGITFDVGEGEIFGFLGPNGAGKTTTVRMLTTLLSITSGSATVAGYDVAAKPRQIREVIGVALQEAGLDPFPTGRALLRLQCGLYGLGRRAAAERADELFALVGLTDAADRRVSGYSGGMRRRLDLAMALVHQPRVLFLDEPTTGLDPASRASIWSEVVRLNDSGTTIFLTTQYLEEADRLAARVAIIDEGRIVALDTPEALKAGISCDVVTVRLPGHDLALLQQRTCATAADVAGYQGCEMEPDGISLLISEAAAKIPDLVRRLDDAGVEALGLEVHTPTLDDVFLQATGHRLEGAEDAEGEAAAP